MRVIIGSRSYHFGWTALWLIAIELVSEATLAVMLTRYWKQRQRRRR